MSKNATQTTSCNGSSALIDTSCLKLHIHPLDISNLKGVEGRYKAHAIEIDGRYYYSGLGSLILISKRERDAVIQNPKLYYFSTALKLHNRLTRQATSIDLQEADGGQHV